MSGVSSSLATTPFSLVCEDPKIACLPDKVRLLCAVTVPRGAPLVGDTNGKDILDHLEEALNKYIKAGGLPANTKVVRIGGRGLSIQLDGNNVSEELRQTEEKIPQIVVEQAKSVGISVITPFVYKGI